MRDRYDVSSLKVVWHLGAPCPPWLKETWIDWLGAEAIWELYAGTEAQAATIISGVEWLEHRGSVGRPLVGEMKVVRADGTDADPGEVGEVFMRPDATPRACDVHATSAPRRSASTAVGSRSATWARSTPTATCTSPTARPT